MGTYAGSQAQENPNAAVRQLPQPERAAGRLECDTTQQHEGVTTVEEVVVEEGRRRRRDQELHFTKFSVLFALTFSSVEDVEDRN